MPLPDQASYRAHTRRYDEEINASRLVDRLAPAGRRRSEFERSVEHVLRGPSALRSAAVAELQKLRDELVRTDFELSEAAVTILIDHSGSMKGEKALAAAVLTDVLGTWLQEQAVTVEVLGFTTRTWRGGRPYRNWQFNPFRKSNPGRLCELRHIIYGGQHASGSWAWDLGLLLLPAALKENVDGEALLWAAARLRCISKPRRVLIQISDGAPVDDATLIANGPFYLDAHFRKVAEELTDSQETAFGVWSFEDRTFAQVRFVCAPQDSIGRAESLVGLLRTLLLATVAR